MKNLILFVIVSFLSLSCSSNTVIQPENTNGEVRLNLDKANTPSEVVLVKVELLNDKFDNQTIEIQPQNSNGEAYFDKVEVGNWKIKVSAFNSDNELIYFGSSNISVVADEVTTISIKLNRVNGGSTGSIFIFVTWEESLLQNCFDHPANPILKKQNIPLDFKGVAHSSVLKTGNKYMMWYTGVAQGVSHIFCATSTDGLNWNYHSTDPVLSPDTSHYWERRYVGSCVVIKENEQFKMYYTGRNADDRANTVWSIGLAVSSDGFNWRKRENPVLSGIAGKWDSKIAVSDIRIIDGTYYLYYTGKANVYDHQIGLATSTDGINWIRYNNNPILTSTQTWEGAGIYYPSIIKEDNQFVMVFQNSYGNRISGFGLAYSTDGVNWTKDTSNPFFTEKNTINKSSMILYPNFLKTEKEYRIYYTSYNYGNGGYSINLIRKIFQ